MNTEPCRYCGRPIGDEPHRRDPLCRVSDPDRWIHEECLRADVAQATTEAARRAAYARRSHDLL